MRKQKMVWRSQVTGVGVGWGSRPLGLTGTFEDCSFAFLSDLISENILKTAQEMGFKCLTE